MNVTVFGATGAIGQLVVMTLLARGHRATAYVRSPDKVPGDWGDRVRVVVGELSEVAGIEDALTGAAAVISALGPITDRTSVAQPLIDGTRRIVEAMERAGIARYVGLATPSSRDPRDRRVSPALIPVLLVRVSLPQAWRAVTGMTEVVTSSSLDWTIVRYLWLTDEPRGVRRVGYVGRGVGARIARADVALFAVDQLDSHRWSRAMPQISD